MLAKQYVLIYNIVWVSWPRNLKVLSIKSFNISGGGYSILFFLYEDVFLYRSFARKKRNRKREIKNTLRIQRKTSQLQLASTILLR